jgi:transposase
MSTSLLYHAYGINGVQYQSTKFEEGNITIYAEMTKQHSQCNCGCLHTHFKGQKRRLFKMIPFGKKKCYLDLLLHRLECPQCARKWWPQLPFMKGKFRMVRSFIAYVLDLLHFSTIQDISRFLGVSWNVIKKIHKEKLGKLYQKIPLEELEYISVDEFSIRKGHEYMTVFTDLQSGRIIHAVEGRTVGVITPFLKKLAKHALKLKAIAMDMSTSYYPAAQEFLPNVDVVFDHFHVTALMNKALDEVRKEQQSQMNISDAKIMKGSRFLFLKNYEDLGTDNQSRLEALLTLNEPLFKAYSLKEQFRHFWEKNSAAEAEEFFMYWGLDALSTGLKPLKKLIKTLNRYKQGLLNYFKHGITNAAAEGINNKIKTMKRQAYGFRDMEYFILRLYHLHESRYAFVG